MLLLKDLVLALLDSAEKASAIARELRYGSGIFDSIVEEKAEGKGKNDRFLQDFKTLADVLIQEMLRYHLQLHIPGLSAGSVGGEEDNVVTDGKGEKVVLVIGPTQQDTVDRLSQALDGKVGVAELLAAIVHDPATYGSYHELESIGDTYDPDDVGIWIDPIDGTNEYIKGGSGPVSAEGIVSGGLPVTAVLIGAYLKSSGEPIVGVISQPFHNESKPYVRTTWGIVYGATRAVCMELHDIASKASERKVVVMSASETTAIKSAIAEFVGEARFAAGGGYKIICVIDGKADAYILSQGSTYKWDTCAPHAVLRALGGDIIDKEGKPILYNKPDNPADTEHLWSNSRGVIAYRHETIVGPLKKVMGTRS